MSNKEVDYKQQIIDRLNSIDTSGLLLEMCIPVLNHVNFSWYPAAVKKHHAYYGGLLKHTCEVFNFALDAVANIKQADKTVVAVASIWHDYGKLTDYKMANVDHVSKTLGEISYTSRASKEGHLVVSYHKFRHFAARTVFIGGGYTYVNNSEWVDEVAHCIIGHHGRKEWGSPREPATLEALAVHQADMMSVMVECGGNPALRENAPAVNVYKGEDLTEGDIITGVLVGAKTATQYIFQKLDKNGCPIVVHAAKPTLDNQVKMPLRCITYIRPPEAYASPAA